MAQITENNKIVGFDYSDESLENAINKYKCAVNDGTFINPCPPQCYAELGISIDLVRTVIGNGQRRTDTWYKRAEMLKKLLEWLRSEMSTESHWIPGKTAKTIFLLKQDWGDGVTLEDKPDPKAKKQSKRYNITFGGNDKRSKAAWD